MFFGCEIFQKLKHIQNLLLGARSWRPSLLGWRPSLLRSKKLLVAPGISTRNKKRHIHPTAYRTPNAACLSTFISLISPKARWFFSLQKQAVPELSRRFSSWATATAPSLEPQQRRRFRKPSERSPRRGSATCGTEEGLAHGVLQVHHLV